MRLPTEQADFPARTESEIEESF